MQRIEIDSRLVQKGTFAQLAAACVDMGQEEAEHEEGTGGEEPQAGQFVETWKLLLFDQVCRVWYTTTYRPSRKRNHSSPMKSSLESGVATHLLCHCNGYPG